MLGLSVSLALGAGGRSEAGQPVPSPSPPPPPPPPPPASSVRHIAMLGQSEPHRLFLSNHANAGEAGTVVDEGALELWWYDLDTNSPNNATGVQRDAVTNANKVSRWAVEMSNALSALAPGVQFKVCMMLFAGTGLNNLLNDTAGGGRQWSRAAPYNGDKECYDAFIADTGIAQPDAAFMAWQNTDSAQIQYQVGDAWWTALTGTALDDGASVAVGATRHNVTYDHFLSEMWDTETVPFTMLMHRYDVLNGGLNDWDRFRDVRVSFDRMVGSALNQARPVPVLRGVDPNAYENGYDVNDGSHPRKTDEGATKYAQQLAYNMARMSGTVLPAPQLDAVTWAPGSVTLGCDAGDLTTIRMLRSQAVPAGQPKIAQLYFRTAENPEQYVEVPDAAISVTGGDIVINAASLLSFVGVARSAFVRGDRLEFASGSAGSNDTQDTTDDTWMDYPGIGHPTLELVPLQPVNGVMVCDLGPAPSVANVLMDMATWAAAEGLPDQGDGWFVPSINRNFDSNSASELDASALTGGPDSATIVVDIDRQIGRDAQSSTQISLRDVSGVGHQKLRVSNLWGEISVSNVAGVIQTSGWIPLPDGRVRIWAYVDSTPGGRHMLYLNNSGTGGAYGFAGLYDGQLPVSEIAAL